MYVHSKVPLNPRYAVHQIQYPQDPRYTYRKAEGSEAKRSGATMLCNVRSVDLTSSKDHVIKLRSNIAVFVLHLGYRPSHSGVFKSTPLAKPKKKPTHLNNRRRPSSALSASIHTPVQTSGGDRLLDSQDELQSQFERLQEQPDAVAEEGQGDGDGGNGGVEPEVVCGRDDDEQDEERVGESCKGVESTGKS